MRSNRTSRVTLLSVILVLGSFTAFITPTVGAESTSGETTLYFHQYDIEFGGIIDQDMPTKENDSMLPPKILDEEFGAWFIGWFIAIQMKNMMDEYMDEFLNDPAIQEMLNETGMTLEELLAFLGEDFGFLNPYQVKETYTYTGEESVDIKGNIIFHLYFKGNFRPVLPKFNDEVALEILVNNKKIENKTVTLTNKIFGGQIQDYSIIIENVDFSLEYGDELAFSVEIIPSNKTISKFIERGGILKERTFEDFIEIILNRAEKMSTRENLPKVQELGETLLLVFDENESIPLNMSLADFADLSNAILSSSFVFDSIDHPSSITLPSRLSGEDIRTYYLHDENQMDEERIYNDKENSTSIREGPVKWKCPDLERSKILKTATAKLYIKHRNVLKKTVTVTLFSGENEIDSISKELPMNLIFIDPDEPMTFTFENIDKEISYENYIYMEVSLGNVTINPIKAEVLHDSADFLSSLTVKFEETDNIQLEYYANPSDEKIIPGGQVEYTLNVSSAYEDTIEIDALIRNQEGEWNVTVEPESVDTDSGDTAKVNIVVKSENNKKEAYGDTIDLTFIVSGKTGIAKKTASVEVSEDAIEYDVDIIGQDESKNIKKGKSGTFYFVVENKNTGAIDDVDSYTITAKSKNDWELKVTDSTQPLLIGEKTDPTKIFVIVYVPKNTTLDSDVITVTATSDGNSETFAVINVTVNVLGPSIFESIYEFFESAANSLGFEDMFGSKAAPYALAGILVIIIVLIIAILIFLLKRKSVSIVCTDRIQEIDPDGEAVFEIILKNPTKKTKTCEISSKEDPPSSKWQIATDRERMTIAAHKSESILLVVKPAETVKSNDWTEVKLNVRVIGKKKSEEITTMVMVKEGKTLLRIKDVFSWPKEFKKGDRVTTSFKLENTGCISARNVQVILFINGKQKNKVEVTIPSGGYADIKIPWIALKGKNELQLKAIEQ